MKIIELRKEMMKCKKTNPNRSKVLQSILGNALLIAKNDKNREVTSEDIIQGAKRELKMAQQSKDSGAPYIPEVFDICEEFLPKLMSAEETKEIVQDIINSFEDKSKKMMEVLMKELSSKYTNIDKGIASKIAREILV